MKESNYIEREFEALGTYNYIRIYDSESEDLLEQAVSRVMDINNLMSAFRPGSDIDRINHNAGIKATPVSEEIIHLLTIARRFSESSGGAFDITVRPLVQLWGIGKKGDYLPTREEIEEAKRLIHYEDVIIDYPNSTVYLQKVGQAIDLGGIAKGYAADEVRRVLTEGGIQSAIINLGGNVITIGLRPDKTLWRVGIQNPKEVTGTYLGMVSIENKTIVTSGVNERYFIKDGIRYHHILDPRTGAPARSGLLSVTVVGESSVIADALTTALFVLGMEQGKDVLKASGAEAIFVTDAGKVFTTKGLRENFNLA